MAGVELECLHALRVSLRNVQVPVLIIFREREGGAVIYEHSSPVTFYLPHSFTGKTRTTTS